MTMIEGSSAEPQVLVVGGSGLIGSAIQALAIRDHTQGCFTFTFAKNRTGVRRGLRALKLDLLAPHSGGLPKGCSRAIYVAGSADHALASRDPRADLDLNTAAFLKFMDSFSGELVLLSSQAVYYGLTGEIPEGQAHIAETPYGLSKQMTEEYAKYFLRTGRISSLWIVRLMYAFGFGERASRLIPTCARAASGGRAPLELRGGGASFLNPLPATFVADVLTRAARCQRGARRELAVTNLNYPSQIRVIDVATFLADVVPFKFSVKEGGEEWPVRFWGDTRTISRYLDEWRLPWPDVWGEMRTYFKELVGK